MSDIVRRGGDLSTHGNHLPDGVYEGRIDRVSCGRDDDWGGRGGDWDEDFDDQAYFDGFAFNFVARRVRESFKPKTPTKISMDFPYEDWKWRTREGVTTRLGAMESSHLFNSMKMLFNHMAAEHGGEPLWYTKHYESMSLQAITQPGLMAHYIVAMLRILEKRKDVYDAHKPIIEQIRKQIFPGEPEALPIPVKPAEYEDDL